MDLTDSDGEDGQVKEWAKEVREEEEGRLNWFAHFLDANIAVATINYMKVNMIPVFFELAKKFKDYGAVPSSKRLDDLIKYHAKMQAVLNELHTKYASIADDRWEGFNRVFSQPEFSTLRWSTIYYSLHLSSIEILAAFANYLEQSSTVLAESNIRESDDCTYFFNRSIENSIRTHLRTVRKLTWLEWMNTRWGELPLKILGAILRLLIFIFDWIIPLPRPHLQALITSCFDCLNVAISEQRKKENQIDLYGPGHVTTGGIGGIVRGHKVLEQTRHWTREFFTTTLQALESTMLNFWVIRLRLVKHDEDDLKKTQKVIRSVQDVVWMCFHEYTLLTQREMRPYGFIVSSLLRDCLPHEKWKYNIAVACRRKLVSTFSIFTNWRFEYTSNYPRPIIASTSGLADTSLCCQSMLMSLNDFQALFRVSKLLSMKVYTVIQRRMTTIGPNGPWHLVHSIERHMK